MEHLLAVFRGWYPHQLMLIRSYLPPDAVQYAIVFMLLWVTLVLYPWRRKSVRDE